MDFARLSSHVELGIGMLKRFNWLKHSIRKFSPQQIQPAKSYFEKHGYVVFKDAFSPSRGEAFWSDVEQAISEQVPLSFSCYGQFYTNPDVPMEGFKLPRIIDAEHHIESCRGLALSPIVKDFLSAVYGITPTCLQTLTYKFSSEQGAHSDYSLVSPPHSPTYDRDTLAASWFALEDADLRNGALVIYPGSHKIKTRSIYDDAFEMNYDRFSEHCAEECLRAGCEPVVFQAKAGDVLFWHGNLVHAGGRILAPEAQPTRKSLVCHYAAIPDNEPSGDGRWERKPFAGASYFAKVEEPA